MYTAKNQLLRDLYIPPSLIKMSGNIYVYIGLEVWGDSGRLHMYQHETYWSRQSAYWILLYKDSEGVRVEDWEKVMTWDNFNTLKRELDIIFIKDLSILFDFIDEGSIEIL